MEIRTDALKLLAMLRRPVPRAAATVGAWLNILQVVTKIRMDEPFHITTIEDIGQGFLLGCVYNN